MKTEKWILKLYTFAGKRLLESYIIRIILQVNCKAIIMFIMEDFGLWGPWTSMSLQNNAMISMSIYFFCMYMSL